jgi:ubiquinone/menaquinone biosynthesis C-methylase UbiE
MVIHLRNLLIKHAVGYENPRKYWDAQWRFGGCRIQDGWQAQFGTVKHLMNRHDCGSILEVGCGRAELRNLKGYIGLDFSPYIRKKNTLSNFVFADVTEKIPLPSKSVDAALSRNVLLHIAPDKIENAVQEISRVTKKLIILDEPVSTATVHDQPHCWTYNLPEMFSRHFAGETVFLRQ